jgi:hypothetical protein
MEKLTNILLNNTFIGVVENNIDPDKKQRIQVRIPYLHGKAEEIPTSDLPWVHAFKHNANSFQIPDKDKIVNVRFPSGDLYYGIYESVEHLNVNLQKKLEQLSDKNYTEFIALCYNHNTQIFIDETDGLMLRHKYNYINVAENEITLGLKDNLSKLKLGANTADQEAVLGTNWFRWFDKFMATLPSLYLTTAPGNPVAPTPTLAQLIAEYQSLKLSFLSKHVVIPDNLTIKPDTTKYDGQIGDKYEITIDEATLDVTTAKNQRTTIEKQNNPAEDTTTKETKDVDSFIPDNNAQTKEILHEEGLTVTNADLPNVVETGVNEKTYGVKATEPQDTNEYTDEEYDAESMWLSDSFATIDAEQQEDTSPKDGLNKYLNAKLVAPVSTSSPAVYDASLALPNPASGNDLADVTKLVRYMKSQNYIVETKPYVMNIVGIRSAHKDDGVITNKFDDYLWQFFKNDKNQWELYKFVITTTPGFKPKSTILPPGPKGAGCGMVIYGQYVNAYSIGWHASRDGTTYRNGKLEPAHPCLKNSQVNIVRHPQGAKRYLTRKEIKAQKKKIATGFNIHRSGYKRDGNNVFNYSEGCQVFKVYNQYVQFMNNNYRQRDIAKKTKFTYTLISQTDFHNFKG